MMCIDALFLDRIPEFLLQLWRWIFLQFCVVQKIAKFQLSATSD
jgi:hypothetical protein